MSLEDLYREVILDHYRNPRHREPISEPDTEAEGVNPLCGDEVKVALQFEDGAVSGVSVTGQGCSISQSSGSMMSTEVLGKTTDEVADLTKRFREMLDSDEPLPEPVGSTLGELEALAGVRKYPVRLKCALLPWTTLEEALAD